MPSHKTLDVKIEMYGELNNCKEEDIAKQCLPYLTPFLTRRHGVNNGTMILNDSTVVISWEYKDFEEEDTYEYD